MPSEGDGDEGAELLLLGCLPFRGAPFTLSLSLLVGVTLSHLPAAARPVLTTLPLRSVRALKRWQDFLKVGEGFCPAVPAVRSMLTMLFLAPVFRIKITQADAAYTVLTPDAGRRAAPKAERVLCAARAPVSGRSRTVVASCTA